MSEALVIQGGKVYDPTHGIDGTVRDVVIVDGKVVAQLPAGASARRIDARGMVVMPGGVDIHCHIASASINLARRLQGEEHASHVHPADPRHQLRGGTGLVTPSTFVTGYRYAALGYTTALDAAVAPSAARHTHLQLADTPHLSAGFLLLLGNHSQVIDLLQRGEKAAVTRFIATLLARTAAYGIKVVNPGGVAAWRDDPEHYHIESLDEAIAGTSVTPRAILHAMCDAAEALNLPHAPHIHCNHLGVPGNIAMTRATMEALAGRRAHFTHIQFHAYGQGKRGGITDASADLLEMFNRHREFSADVGQVMFGPGLTVTADTPQEYLLWQLLGQRYVSVELEQETGCGVMPIRYRDKQYLHSLQWAIGLQLMLGCTDPWRMALSTDHPNGGSFLTYPAIIAALMSKTVRDEQIAKAHPRAMQHCALREMTREMSLSEIAIITRAGPARILGLRHKGHLGAGADGDVTVYPDQTTDPQAMFSHPRYVVAAGRVVVEDGELRDPGPGSRFHAGVATDEQGESLLKQWLDEAGSYDVRQFGV
jgi:formylmethanofuran dehydrogenase subunit A